jgi:hypothetical protein
VSSLPNWRFVRIPLKIAQRLNRVTGSIESKFCNFFAPSLARFRQPKSDDIHLSATIEWLVRAQDACGGHGVSISYSKFGGWHRDPYPETSGYILATFISYADLAGNADLFSRAIGLGNWEIDIQRHDGAVLSSIRRKIVRVFNTGQVVLGWCCLFERTGDQKYLDAALRSGYYLIGVQEQDGSWIRDTHCGARTYHARVAWSLMRLAGLSGEEVFWEAGVKSLRWVLAQQNDNGWFRNCGFNSVPPITHVIGYTIRGLLESQQEVLRQGCAALPPSIILEAVQSACQPIISHVRDCSIGGTPGLLPAAFDKNWLPTESYSCLTGNAQLAICLMRLGQITGTRLYIDAASRLIDALKRIQNLNSKDLGVRGGVAGSFPFSKGYHGGEFPNWAAKFMADALMIRIKYPKLWIQA